MADVLLKHMIHYMNENDDKKYYKLVEATEPDFVKYEDGMLIFEFLNYFNIQINGKTYYCFLPQEEKRYSFGEFATAKDILRRIDSGEEFASDFRDIIAEYIKENENKTFFITPKKDILLPVSYRNCRPVMRIYPTTPDIEIGEDQIISCKVKWFIEYQNKDRDKWFLRPTFCSDKKYRYDPQILFYRFVKCACYEINGDEYVSIYEREKELHISEETQYDKIDEALDGAKKVISEKQSNDNYFKGYTRIYPFNTEDSSSAFKVHEDDIKGQNVLSVTGSGDAELDLFLYGANSVTCFDINGLAKYYAKLKFLFIKAGMTFEEYKEFFLGDSKWIILRKDLYDKYSDNLDEETRKFWDGIYHYINVNDIKLLHSEHNLFYKIYGMFGNANKSFQNPYSYFNEKNYAKLQLILQSKNLDNLKFVDASLFDIDQILQGNYYGYVYLSNIMDFIHLYYQDSDSLKRLAEYKKFILERLSRIINADGKVVISFISQNWQIGGDYTENDCRQIFLKEDGFYKVDLRPYNDKDSIWVYEHIKRNLDVSLR